MYSGLSTASVDVVVGQKVAGNAPCHYCEEDLRFYINLDNASKLGEIPGIFLFWDEIGYWTEYHRAFLIYFVRHAICSRC